MNNVVRPDADFIRSHTEKANKLLLEANYSKKSQHFSKAVEEYKVALSHALLFKTEVIPCLLNLAAANITAGNCEKGAEILNLLLEEKQYTDKIKSNGVLQGHIFYHLGRASFQDKDRSKLYFEDAVQKYKAEKSSTTHIASAMSELAEVYISQNNYIQAVATLQEVSDLYMGDNTEKSCHTLLKMIELLLNHEDIFTMQQTKNVLKTLCERMKEIENFNSKCKVKCKIASVYVSMCLEGDALNTYEEILLELGEELTVDENKLKAHVVYCMANLYHKKDDPVKAAQLVSQAVDLYGKLGDRSKQGDCFCIQADFQLQGNMKEEAVQSLNHAVQAYKDADNKVSLWQSFEKLGDIYMQDSKYEKATSMYKNAHHVQANGDESSKELVTKLSMALNYELKVNKDTTLLSNNKDAQNLQAANSSKQEELVSTKINEEKNVETENKNDDNSEEENVESDYSAASSSINQSEPQVEALSRLKKVVIKVNDEYEENRNEKEDEASDSSSESDSNSTSSDTERKVKKRRKLKAGRRDEIARYRGRGLSAQPLPINEILSESSDETSESLPFVASNSEVKQNIEEEKIENKSASFDTDSSSFSTSSDDEVQTENVEKPNENVQEQVQEIKNEEVTDKKQDLKRLTHTKQLDSEQLALQRAKVRKKNEKKRKVKNSKACLIM